MLLKYDGSEEHDLYDTQRFMVWCRAGLRIDFPISLPPTFFTSHKHSQPSETRMHYTMCCAYVAFSNNSNPVFFILKQQMDY